MSFFKVFGVTFSNVMYMTDLKLHNLELFNEQVPSEIKMYKKIIKYLPE